MALVEGMTQSEWSHYQRLLEKGTKHGLRYLNKKDREKCGCIHCRFAYCLRDDEKVEMWRIDGLYKGTVGSLFCPFKGCPYMSEFKEYLTYEDYDRAEQIKWKHKTIII